MNLLAHLRCALLRFRDSRGGAPVSRPRREGDSESGYALLMVVFMVGLVIVGTSAIVPSLITQARRQREEEMIWRGKQYDRAIKHFFKKEGRYPTSLDDLVKDTHSIYFMRKAYKDPMNTEDGSWRLIYITSTGQLIGSVRWNSLQQMANDLRPNNCSPANGGNSQNPAGLGGGFGSDSGSSPGNSGNSGFGNSGFVSSPSGGQPGSGSSGQNPLGGQNSGGGLGGLLGNGQSGAGSSNGSGATPAGGPSGAGGCPAGATNGNPAGIGTSATNGTSGANGTSAPGSGPSTPVTTQYGDQNLNGLQNNPNSLGGQSPSNTLPGQAGAPGTSASSSDDSDIQATQLVGGNIVGVASKINKPSLKHFEKATKYKQFEFIWNPLLEVTNAANAALGGAPGGTTGSALGGPLGSSGQQGTGPTSGAPAPTPSPGSGQPSP